MHMNKILHSAILAGLLAGTPAFAADEPRPGSTMDAKMASQIIIATVNGTPLSQLSANILRQERQIRGLPQDARTEDAAREALITAEVMAQEAMRKGLDKDPTVQAVIELQRKEILGKMLLEHHADTHPVPEARIKEEYEKIKGKTGDMEYHARHILVDDEKLAKEIIVKLGGKKPAKFEDLAKKHSKDSSAAKGGDLGWMSPASLVPEFSTAMVQLKKGAYTKTPVKSQFGWHVIKLDETRKLEFPEYEKVKTRIANQLTQQELRKYIAELRSTAKVDTPAK